MLTRYQRLLIEGFGIRGTTPWPISWLTPPSRTVFFILVLLAVLALLVRCAHVAIPVVSNHSFETLLIAFLLFLAGLAFGRALQSVTCVGFGRRPFVWPCKLMVKPRA